MRAVVAREVGVDVQEAEAGAQARAREGSLKE